MKLLQLTAVLGLLSLTFCSPQTQTTQQQCCTQTQIDAFVEQYPDVKQARMMRAWLENNAPGTFSFTGLVDPTDATVVSPQATVDYGYNWFSLSGGPAVLTTPRYDKFFSVAIYDMHHNVPAVIVNPEKPIVLARPGQKVPDLDADIVTLETDQGLVFTRMLVVNNLAEVRSLSEQIVMQGGVGDMTYPVAAAAPKLEAATQAYLMAEYQRLDAAGILKNNAVPKKSGDVPAKHIAITVMIGQLATPFDTVQYWAAFNDADGRPIDPNGSYRLDVPPGLVKSDGYISVTPYAVKTKLLIPNAQKIYDRTSYTMAANSDGGYTVMLSPGGAGQNGLPTSGEAYYVLLRAYVPEDGVEISAKLTRVD
ncbi:MAG: DUF1214 domain-containing protein [Pseudomonadota bacterium]